MAAEAGEIVATAQIGEPKAARRLRRAPLRPLKPHPRDPITDSAATTARDPSAQQAGARMQETIAYGTVMMTLGLTLSGIGWRAGPAAAAAFGVVVLLTAHIVTPADLASGFQPANGIPSGPPLARSAPQRGH